jgi:hypothetical protein
MKKINKIYIFAGIIIAIFLLSSFIGLYYIYSNRIQGCWYSGVKTNNIVFFDGKIYKQGGAPNCLGIFRKDKYLHIGEYKKEEDKFHLIIEGENITAEVGFYEMKWIFPDGTNPIIFQRNTDFKINKEAFDMIQKAIEDKKQKVPSALIHE